VIEHLRDAIKPDISQGEAPIVPIYEARRGPGSTSEVDFWTSREVREVAKSHINYMVADTKTWEESAAYLIDTNDAVDAFVKNAGLGFAIPYFYNGEAHDYIPDFIVRLKTDGKLTEEVASRWSVVLRRSSPRTQLNLAHSEYLRARDACRDARRCRQNGNYFREPASALKLFQNSRTDSGTRRAQAS